VTGAGRPRADLDDAIFQATLRLLAEEGYQRLTMGAVAAAAGIGKPTLYRRYASKPALVVAVLLALDGKRERMPLPDGTREALAALLAATAVVLASPGTMTILGSLLAQARNDPALIEAFRVALFRPQHEVVHATIRRGVERGEVRADIDIEAVDAMLFGSLLARATLGEPVDEAWARRVVAAAWPAIGKAGGA
jgi:AcrR family transcriptional regulator